MGSSEQDGRTCWGIASVGWAELRTRIEQKATAATSPVVDLQASATGAGYRVLRADGHQRAVDQRAEIGRAHV